MRAGRLAQMLKRSHPSLAEAIVTGLAADPRGIEREIPPLAAPSSSAETNQLLTVEDSPVLPNSPIWEETVETTLEEIVREWLSADRLRSVGLNPAQAVLLSGPPGVGKTLAASWLSHRLELPLATVNLASLMDSKLGKTGQNLAEILAFGKTRRCVLFLDEFDALAKRRDDHRDVGELRRVVNVLLQAVDHWKAPSLLIAATNHPQLVDPAMFRRFDIHVEFPNVSKELAEKTLLHLGVSPFVAAEISPLCVNQPLSQVFQRFNFSRKKALLTDGDFQEILLSQWRIADASSAAKLERRRERTAALALNGLSAREIAKTLGVSHSTVLRDLKG